MNLWPFAMYETHPWFPNTQKKFDEHVKDIRCTLIIHPVAPKTNITLDRMQQWEITRKKTNIQKKRFFAIFSI